MLEKALSITELMRNGHIRTTTGQFVAVVIVSDEMRPGVAKVAFNAPGSMADPVCHAVPGPVSGNDRCKLGRGVLRKLGESACTHNFPEMQLKPRPIAGATPAAGQTPRWGQPCGSPLSVRHPPEWSMRMLRAVAEGLAGLNLRVIGVVREPAGSADRHRCEMDPIELATGRRHAISQNLGRGSKGCRLDGAAVKVAAAMVAAQLDNHGADPVIINRFGKMETLGRGFRPLIARALELDTPVLVGANDLNRPAFEAFAQGLASELPDQPGAALVWAGPLLRPVAA